MLTKNGVILLGYKVMSAAPSDGNGNEAYRYISLITTIMSTNSKSVNKIYNIVYYNDYSAHLTGYEPSSSTLNSLGFSFVARPFNTDTSWIRLETADVTPKVTDYAVSNTEISLSSLQDSVNYVYDEVDNEWYIIHNFTGIYSGSENATLYTVKMYKKYRCAIGDSLGNSLDFLIVHQKLNTPIAVKPGDSVLFTVKIRLGGGLT